MIEISVSEKRIGDNIQISDDVKISKLRKLIIGDNSRIGSSVVINGDDELRIGMNCWIGDECVINVRRKVEIEDNVCLGIRSMIFTHGTWPEVYEGYEAIFAPVKIEKNVWIGPGSMILPGITIGRDSIVGAGAVVTKSIPPKVMVAGVPARIIKKEYEYKKEMSVKQKKESMKNIISGFIEYLRNWNYKVREIEKDCWSCSSGIFNRFHVLFINKFTESADIPSKETIVFAWEVDKWAPTLSIFEFKTKIYNKTNKTYERHFLNYANDFLIRFAPRSKIHSFR